MTYIAATRAQQGYYKSLTGEWLPKGTSKQRAAGFIAKAKAMGPAAKKPRHIGVSSCIVSDHCRIDDGRQTWEVYVDWRFYKGGFDSQEAAVRFAQSVCLDGETVELGGTRYQISD